MDIIFFQCYRIRIDWSISLMTPDSIIEIIRCLQITTMNCQHSLPLQFYCVYFWCRECNKFFRYFFHSSNTTNPMLSNVINRTNSSICQVIWKKHENARFTTIHISPKPTLPLSGWKMADVAHINTLLF